MLNSHGRLTLVSLPFSYGYNTPMTGHWSALTAHTIPKLLEESFRYNPFTNAMKNSGERPTSLMMLTIEDHHTITLMNPAAQGLSERVT